ncbi:MAG: hypothetical protein WC043_01505 [Pseudobdellovibrionaceae bacterium]
MGNVIPAQAGIHSGDVDMDSGLRRSDGGFVCHAVAERHPYETNSGNDGDDVKGSVR